MFSLRLRPLTFVDRLALCAVAVPLLLLSLNRGRAEDVCPDTKAKREHCVKEGYGACGAYSGTSEDNCKGNKMRTIYVVERECGDKGLAPGYFCYPVEVWGVAIEAICFEDYQCEWVTLGKICQKGDRSFLGTAPIYWSDKCPAENNDVETVENSQ